MSPLPPLFRPPTRSCFPWLVQFPCSSPYHLWSCCFPIDILYKTRRAPRQFELFCATSSRDPLLEDECQRRIYSPTGSGAVRQVLVTRASKSASFTSRRDASAALPSPAISYPHGSFDSTDQGRNLIGPHLSPSRKSNSSPCP
jgi:hypothetical protein